jgi:hypothetical protein
VSVAMSSWPDPVNAVAAVASAVAAGAAWYAARHSNQTADSLARIERERWHSELAPEFDFTLADPEGDRVKLHVLLTGPDDLRRLDEVRISIRNDDRVYEARPGHDGPTQEELDAFVWGPYRFPFGADGADQDGRGVAPFPLDVGAGNLLVLERTRPGRWMTGTSREGWQRQWRDFPIRLTLICRRGDEEWRLERRLSQPPHGSIVAVG